MNLAGIEVGVVNKNGDSEKIIRVRLGDGWITCSASYARLVAHQLIDAAHYIDPQDEDTNDDEREEQE